MTAPTTSLWSSPRLLPCTTPPTALDRQTLRSSRTGGDRSSTSRATLTWWGPLLMSLPLIFKDSQAPKDFHPGMTRRESSSLKAWISLLKPGASSQDGIGAQPTQQLRGLRPNLRNSWQEADTGRASLPDFDAGACFTLVHLCREWTSVSTTPASRPSCGLTRSRASPRPATSSSTGASPACSRFAQPWPSTSRHLPSRQARSTGCSSATTWPPVSRSPATAPPPAAVAAAWATPPSPMPTPPPALFRVRGPADLPRSPHLPTQPRRVFHHPHLPWLGCLQPRMLPPLPRPLLQGAAHPSPAQQATLPPSSGVGSSDADISFPKAQREQSRIFFS